MELNNFFKPQNPTITIGNKETAVDFLGQAPEDVKVLSVNSNNKTADLSLLADYPNIEKLFLNGDFANVDGVSELKRLNWLVLVLSASVDLSGVRAQRLKSLSLHERLNNGFEGLLCEGLEYLELYEIRKLTDLSFIEKAAGLKKMYLYSLPAVEKLPDFGKLPNLYALKLYELHKLNDIDSLTRSNLRYLDFALVADKLSGTKLAEVLLGMERLEWALLIPDRSSDRRYSVMENRLRKAGREQLLAYCDIDKWRKL